MLKLSELIECMEFQFEKYKIKNDFLLSLQGNLAIKL